MGVSRNGDGEIIVQPPWLYKKAAKLAYNQTQDRVFR
jgi:hypothetical protein